MTGAAAGPTHTMHTYQDGSSSRSGGGGEWRIAAILGLLGVVCVAYADSVASIVAIWSNDGFRHGYLIPVVFLYLLWLQRGEIGAASLSPSWTGVLLVAASVWLWLLGRQALIQVVEHVALLLVFQASVIAVMGWRVYARTAFALWYLALAIPAGLSTIPWLMQFTADFSMWGLKILGVPAFREEMFFQLPGGRFEVAEACSGYRYVFSGLALTALIAYLDLRSWWRRFALVALAVPGFVLLNGVRATLVMAIASASEMRYLGDDHIWFGWLLFFLLLIGIYLLVQRFSDVPRASS